MFGTTKLVDIIEDKTYACQPLAQFIRLKAEVHKTRQRDDKGRWKRLQ